MLSRRIRDIILIGFFVRQFAIISVRSKKVLMTALENCIQKENKQLITNIGDVAVSRSHRRMFA